MMGLRIINKIKQDRHFIFTVISLLAVAVWYFNFTYWQNYIIYGLALIIYGTINSAGLGKILTRYGFEKEIQFIFGVFLLIFFIAFGMAIPIVLYKVTQFYLLGLLLFLSLAISFWSKKLKTKPPVSNFSEKLEESKPVFKIPKVVYFLWLIIFAFSFFLLFYARTGEYIRSPWKVINPLYLYAWLFMIFFIGLLIFSKLKLKYFLLIVILSSLLLHAYLLIPYEMGFGGDKWRHLGAEKWLIEENIYTPALFGEEVSYKKIGPLKVPEVFIAGNKTSYANMWGLVIALSWLTGLDVFWIDLILGALLFSIFLPFLLLKIGSFISLKKEFLYLMILAPFLFYPFQAYGSVTVPMSFAFLPFLFALIFMFKYFLGPPSSKKLLLLLVFFIPFLFLNYILYLILFLEILLLAIIFKNISTGEPGRGKKVYIPLLVLCFILILFFIPFLDTANQFSWFKHPFPSKTETISALKDFPKRLLLSEVIFPRIYRFEQDNWLYAITNEHFSRSILVKVLPWNVILTPLVWLLVIFGFLRYHKLKHPRIGWLLLIMLLVILFNQLIASYFMEGNHIFTKRLVIFNSFLIFIPLAWGGYQLTLTSLFSRPAIIISLILFLSFLSITVYASGPKFQVVTKDEFTAAEYVWQEIKTSPNDNYCVLANTWPLLALEAVSSRQIITGGFPYYYEYRQPERVQLFENMNRYPSIRYLEKALEVTKAEQCYFMTEKRWIDFNQREQVPKQLDKILGKHQQIGEVLIWLYQPNYTVF